MDNGHRLVDEIYQVLIIYQASCIYLIPLRSITDTSLELPSAKFLCIIVMLAIASLESFAVDMRLH